MINKAGRMQNMAVGGKLARKKKKERKSDRVFVCFFFYHWLYGIYGISNAVFFIYQFYGLEYVCA